jgi:hypothetical protein
VVSCVPSGQYEAWNGTSMAAPQIAGCAARLLDQSPALPLVELMARMDERQDEWAVACGHVPPSFYPFTDLAALLSGRRRR